MFPKSRINVDVTPIRSSDFQNKILFRRHSEKAVLPFRSKPGDVGFDLTISRDLYIDPLGFTDAHTDISIFLEPGFWAEICGRSSATRTHGVLVLKGVIDGGYTGELHVAVQNLRAVPFHAPAGTRIAQLIVSRIYDFEWEEVDALPETERGSRGFGSTGA